MLIRAEDSQMEEHMARRKTLQTSGGRTLIIRGASAEQQRKVAEAYIWVLQNFMPEFGEIKRGERECNPAVK